MDRRSVVKLGLAGLAMGAVRMPAAFGQANRARPRRASARLSHRRAVVHGQKLGPPPMGHQHPDVPPCSSAAQGDDRAGAGRALQIARISVGPMGPPCRSSTFNLPFVFRCDARRKVMDGPIGDEMPKKLSDHPTAGLIGLCWRMAGPQRLQQQAPHQDGGGPGPPVRCIPNVTP
jgi:hypothetical protein